MDILVRVDSIIDQYPDSALNLLKSIASPQELNIHDRAEYALLFTKAQDKKYIIQSSDSLIKIAVDYYKKKNDPTKIALSYFYLGSVYRDMEHYTDATDAFLEALRIMPDKSPARLKYLIHSNLSRIYEEQSFYDQAIKARQIAYHISSTQNNKKDIFYSSRELGNLFNFIYEPDSALHYLNEALEIAQSLPNVSWEGTIYCDIARTYNEKKELHLAHQYGTKSLNINKSVATYFLMGKILNQLEKTDSARYYLLKCLDDKNINFRAATRSELSELEYKVGNNEKAFQYSKEFHILRDSISLQKQRLAISALINDDTVKIRTQKLTEKIKQNKIISIISLCIIVVSVSALHIFRNQRKIQRNNLKRKSIDKTYTFNSRKIKVCIDKLKSNEHYKKILYIRNNSHKKEKVLSAKERELLQTIIRESFAELINGMRSEYPQLTNEDILCCILYISGCNNADVRILMGVENGALKSRKSRIKKKLDKETFTLIFETSQTDLLK